MNTKRYFSTEDFKEGLCQLNFDADVNNDIELLMTARDWSLISSETTEIASVDIETHNNQIVVSFVDSELGTNTVRANNPYALTLSVEQTNLVPHIDREQNAIVFDTDDLATKAHTLKIYTENTEEPVAEFKNVKAFRNKKQITKVHVDRYISY